jgi:hypothetical protein
MRETRTLTSLRYSGKFCDDFYLISPIWLIDEVLPGFMVFV